jgi:exonuclease VII large subunit
MKNVKTVYIILAFCLGLFIGYQFLSGGSAPPSTSGISDALKQTEQKVNAIQAKKTSGDSLLNIRNRFLSQQLQQANARLTKSRQDLQKSRNHLFALSKQLKTDSVFAVNALASDSLDIGIAELNQNTDSVISQYEQKISLTEDKVALRDSQLVICEQSYTELKNVLKEQALREQQLSNDLATALRQQKRTRFQNKFLAAGMLFVAGLTTSLVVKSRQ